MGKLAKQLDLDALGPTFSRPSPYTYVYSKFWPMFNASFFFFFKMSSGPLTRLHQLNYPCSVQFSRSVMSDSATPLTVARQVSVSITKSWSLLKLMSIKSVMPSNHLILCHPLLLPTSIFPSIRVSSNESVLHIRWPKY